jgi:drug/metabolite transporter (DMT)-like permease
MTKNNNHLKGILYLTIAASIWGGMFVVSKYTLDFISPSSLISLRYIIALFILSPFCNRSKDKTNIKKLSRRDWLLIFLIGFVGYFLSIFFQFLGTKLTDAHTGSLITTVSPIFTFILAFLILKEKFTFLKIVSIIISISGIMLIMNFSFSMSSHVFGIIMLFLAALSWAILSVLVKLASAKFSSLFITTYAILFALLSSLPVSVYEMSSGPFLLFDYRVILGVLYTGIMATAAAYLLWNKGLQYIDAGIGSLFIFFQTIIGTIFGYIFLNESITINFIAGSILIFSSIIAATYNDLKISGNSKTRNK